MTDTLYTIPKNWRWCILEEVSECLDNFRKPINATERAARKGNIPYYGATGQIGWIDDFLTDEQLVLLGEDGAPFLDTFKDKAYLIEGKAWVNNHAHILRSYFGNFGNRYLKYYLNTFNFAEYVTGTTRLKLTQTKMKNIPIPLPPLAEQKRIVERLDSLFEKLDAAQNLLKSILRAIQLSKVILYQKAFSGALTAEFRANRGISLDDWQEKTLGEIGTLERGKSKHRPRNAAILFGGTIPFIQTGDIANSEKYITIHNKTLSDFGLKQSKLFPKGTLCITIAANIGDVAILSYDCCFPDSVVGFIPNENTITEYIYYIFKFSQKKLQAQAPATAQKNINLKILNNQKINLPPLKEQKEIARRLDSLLGKENQAKEIAQNLLSEIETLKKTILARAFRGELGTNNPSENAVENFI